LVSQGRNTVYLNLLFKESFQQNLCWHWNLFPVMILFSALEEWRKRKMERARQRELEKNGTTSHAWLYILWYQVKVDMIQIQNGTTVVISVHCIAALKFPYIVYVIKCIFCKPNLSIFQNLEINNLTMSWSCWIVYHVYTVIILCIFIIHFSV